MNDSINNKIGLWVYFIFFIAGILSLFLGGVLSNIIRNPILGLSNISGFIIYLIPMFICSIFFAIGMYVFKSGSIIYAIKAFVCSLVASSVIIIFGLYNLDFDDFSNYVFTN